MKKKWSDKEVRYLTKAWTEGVSVKTIAEKLGRSITSVNVKACRMDLGRKSDPEDRITLNQLLLAFGLAQSITHFKAKFIKYKAPIVIKKAGTRTNTFISISDFWKWAEKNKSLLNFSKLEPFILGPEPEWVNERRKLDRNNPKRNRPNKQWTDYEDRLLLEKVKLNRYTYTDLAKEFGRTEGSIRKRLYVLDSKIKPIGYEKSIIWSKEEDAELLKLDAKSIDSYNISLIMNKPELVINARLKLLKELKKNNIELSKKYWTPEEEQYLIDNWWKEDRDLNEICKYLKRSYNAVRAKARRIEEKKSNK